MKSATAVTIDASVWIPYLRSRRYADVVDALVASGRVWLHGVVALELYAGTGTQEDVRAMDAICDAARRLGRFYAPTGDDFVVAGRMLSLHARRYGSVRPRDHSHDLLIAIGAARTKSSLLTANARDMARWARLLRRRGNLAARVLSVPSATSAHRERPGRRGSRSAR